MNTRTPLGKFRIIAICEGISFVILLFVAMPLKYFAGLPQAVTYVGWIHGLLFIYYMVLGYEVKSLHRWDNRKVMTAVIAALLPFGPFMLEKKILSKEQEQPK